jgi:transposase
VAAIAPEQLLYFDETGISTQIARSHGRAPRGQRVDASVPGGWKMVTVLGALSLTGMLACMTVEAATDGDVLLDFLDAFLCPKLRPGDVLVMDNLNVHKVEGVRTRVEAVGARLLYLPPYSPDLNPIEKAWSKLKQLLRGENPRSPEAIYQAIARIIHKITAQDAKAWFRLPLHAV